MKVVAVVRDLFFVARIRETARLVGTPLVFARTPQEIAAQLAPEPPALVPALVIVDLTTNGWDYDAHLRRPRGRRPTCRCSASRPTRSPAQTQPLHARCRAGGDQGDPDPGAARAPAARARRVTAAEFVVALDEANQAVLRRLEPDATLKPEVSGRPQRHEPPEGRPQERDRGHRDRGALARRHHRRRGEDGLRPPGGRRGQALPHDRRPPRRARAWTRARFDPLAQGFGPLFKYLDSLETTVERVAAGQFTREAMAVVKNRQFIEFCDRAGDRLTATLYRDVIEPDERFHHELGRTLLLKLATTPEAQERRAARRRPHPRAGRGAAGRRAPDRRYPPRARLLMDPDPSLADFTAAVTRADADIPLARAALLIAAAEQPALDVDKQLAAPRRPRGGGRPPRARPGRAAPPASPPGVPLRGAGLRG